MGTMSGQDVIKEYFSGTGNYNENKYMQIEKDGYIYIFDYDNNHVSNINSMQDLFNISDDAYELKAVVSSSMPKDMVEDLLDRHLSSSDSSKISYSVNDVATFMNEYEQKTGAPVDCLIPTDVNEVNIYAYDVVEQDGQSVPKLDRIESNFTMKKLDSIDEEYHNQKLKDYISENSLSDKTLNEANGIINNYEHSKNVYDSNVFDLSKVDMIDGKLSSAKAQKWYPSNHLNNDNKSIIVDYLSNLFPNEYYDVVSDGKKFYLRRNNQELFAFRENATLSDALMDIDNYLNDKNSAKSLDNYSKSGTPQRKNNSDAVHINVDTFEKIIKEYKKEKDDVEQAKSIYNSNMFTDKLLSDYLNLVGENKDPKSRLNKTLELLDKVILNIQYSLKAYDNIDNNLGVVFNSIVNEIFTLNSYKEYSGDDKEKFYDTSLSLKEREKYLASIIDTYTEQLDSLKQRYKDLFCGHNLDGLESVLIDEEACRFILGTLNGLNMLEPNTSHFNTESNNMTYIEIDTIQDSIDFLLKNDVFGKLKRYSNGSDWHSSGMYSVYTTPTGGGEKADEQKFLINYLDYQGAFSESITKNYNGNWKEFTENDVVKIKDHIKEQLKFTISISSDETFDNEERKGLNAFEYIKYQCDNRDSLNQDINILSNTIYNYKQYQKIMPYEAEMNGTDYLAYLVRYDKNYDESDPRLQYLDYKEAALYQMYKDSGRDEDALGYLAAMTDLINQRKGIIDAANQIKEYCESDNDFERFLHAGWDGLGDGLENFFDGLGDLFNPSEMRSSDDYRKIYLLNYLKNSDADGFISESLNDDDLSLSNAQKKLIRYTYGTMSIVGQQAIPTLTSLFVSKGLGATLAVLSNAGNSVENALQNGASSAQAYLYGALSGASTWVLNKCMSGIAGLNGKALPNTFGESLNLMGMQFERAFVGTYLDAGLRTLVLGDPFDISVEDAFETAMQSAFAAGVMNSTNKVLMKVANGVTISVSKGEYNNYNEFRAIVEQKLLNTLKETSVGQKIMAIKAIGGERWESFKETHPDNIFVKMAYNLSDDNSVTHIDNDTAEKMGITLKDGESLVFNGKNYVKLDAYNHQFVIPKDMIKYYEGEMNIHNPSYYNGVYNTVKDVYDAYRANIIDYKNAQKMIMKGLSTFDRADSESIGQNALAELANIRDGKPGNNTDWASIILGKTDQTQGTVPNQSSNTTGQAAIYNLYGEVDGTYVNNGSGQETAPDQSLSTASQTHSISNIPTVNNTESSVGGSSSIKVFDENAQIKPVSIPTTITKNDIVYVHDTNHFPTDGAIVSKYEGKAQLGYNSVLLNGVSIPEIDQRRTVHFAANGEVKGGFLGQGSWGNQAKYHVLVPAAELDVSNNLGGFNGDVMFKNRVPLTKNTVIAVYKPAFTESEWNEFLKKADSTGGNYLVYEGDSEATIPKILNSMNYPAVEHGTTPEETVALGGDSKTFANAFGEYLKSVSTAEYTDTKHADTKYGLFEKLGTYAAATKEILLSDMRQETFDSTKTQQLTDNEAMTVLYGKTGELGYVTKPELKNSEYLDTRLPVLKRLKSDLEDKTLITDIDGEHEKGKDTALSLLRKSLLEYNPQTKQFESVGVDDIEKWNESTRYGSEIIDSARETILKNIDQEIKSIEGIKGTIKLIDAGQDYDDSISNLNQASIKTLLSVLRERRDGSSSMTDREYYDDVIKEIENNITQNPTSSKLGVGDIIVPNKEVLDNNGLGQSSSSVNEQQFISGLEKSLGYKLIKGSDGCYYMEDDWDPNPLPIIKSDAIQAHLKNLSQLPKTGQDEYYHVLSNGDLNKVPTDISRFANMSDGGSEQLGNINSSTELGNDKTNASSDSQIPPLTTVAQDENKDLSIKGYKPIKVETDEYNYDVEKDVAAFSMEDFFSADADENKAGRGVIVISDDQVVGGYTRDHGKGDHQPAYANIINAMNGNNEVFNLIKVGNFDTASNDTYIKGKLYNQDGSRAIFFTMPDTITPKQFELLKTYATENNAYVKQLTDSDGDGIVGFSTKYTTAEDGRFIPGDIVTDRGFDKLLEEAEKRIDSTKTLPSDEVILGETLSDSQVKLKNNSEDNVSQLGDDVLLKIMSDPSFKDATIDEQIKMISEKMDFESLPLDTKVAVYKAKLESLAAEDGMTLEELAKLDKSGEVSLDKKMQADDLALDIAIKAAKVEPEITEIISSLEDDDSILIGLEHRLKDAESISRKIIFDHNHSKLEVPDAALRIGDSVRYTMIIDEDKYTQKAAETIQKLVDNGYKILKVNKGNTWNSTAYKGLNTSIETPSGQKFELQFHTTDSYIVKEFYTHLFYEIRRNEYTSSEEKNLSTRIQQLYSSTVPIPDGIIGYDFEGGLNGE